jgi:hypothetical protein
MKGHTVMRPTRLVPALAIVGLVVAALAGPVAAAAPSVSVTPHTKLVDGQTVSVSASGFAPDTEMAVVECATTTVSPSACDLDTVQFVDTDDSGAFSDFPYPVVRALSDGTDCVTNGGCYLGTQSSDGTGGTASTPIKFDPSVPPFVLKVRIDHTDTVNSKGVVAIRGTAICQNGDAVVSVNVTLRQVVDRSIFTSFGFTSTECSDGHPSRFRVTVRPQDGFFGAGPATVSVDGFGNNHDTFHKVAVNLVSQ